MGNSLFRDYKRENNFLRGVFMNYEISELLTQITREKNIDMKYVIETVEAGLLLAAKKKFGEVDNFSVEIEPRSGEIKMVAAKTVVKEITNPLKEISKEEAKEFSEKPKIGQEIKVPIELSSFGRNAILAAKQILIQKIREAEREMIYDRYQEKIGNVITGSVQHVDKGNVVVNLGDTEGVIYAKDQIPREKLRQGDRMKVYILDVQKNIKGPQVILSRACPELLKKLFELEVPEIFERIIEIKAVAREPGERAKIAVSTIDERIDPVGACVGVKGVRVQNIVRELNNERIDVIQWSPEPKNFITRALSPAKVVHIEVNDAEHRMTVVVEEEKLSLAIGKAGQNARLAAKLTGWDIDILSESEYSAHKKIEEGPKVFLTELEGVGEKLSNRLEKEGIDSIQALAKTTVETLTQIEGVGEKKALNLIEHAKQYLTVKRISGEKSEA
jgi:N utilization substance protein A